MEQIKNLLRSVYKVVIHFVTGQCEIERLTIKYPQINKLKTVHAFRHSLRKSKQLVDVKRKTVEQYQEDFSVKRIALDITTLKQFPLNSGVQYAVHHLRQTNLAISHLSSLANTTVTGENDRLLIELFDLLCPNTKLEGTTRKSKSWSSIGFQGLDPGTDFRGAGLLSLYNLIFFAKEKNDVARRILTEQCVDITEGGFPFALTGINLTAFLLSLVTRRKCDELLTFVRKESRATSGTNRLSNANESTPLLFDDSPNELEMEASEQDELAKDTGLETFNLVYTVCFTIFAVRWRELAPANAMGFPIVFKEVKAEIERLVDTEEGRKTLLAVDN